MCYSTSGINNGLTAELIEAEVVAGGKDGTNAEDYLFLRRKDGFRFSYAIPPQITIAGGFEHLAPFVTLYHYPLDCTEEEKCAPLLHLSRTRIISGTDGLLRCQDKLTVTGASRGGPYVDGVTESAFGIHM